MLASPMKSAPCGEKSVTPQKSEPVIAADESSNTSAPFSPNVRLKIEMMMTGRKMSASESSGMKTIASRGESNAKLSA